MRTVALALLTVLVAAPALAGCGKEDDKKSRSGKEGKDGDSDDDEDDAEARRKKRKKKRRDDRASCEAVYAKLKECDKGKLSERMDEDRFVEMCEKAIDDDRRGDDVRASFECAELDTCGEYRKCEAGIKGKRRAKNIVRDVESGRVQDAITSCTYNVEYYDDDDYKDACGKAFASFDKITDDKELERIGYNCTGTTFDKVAKAAPEFAKLCKSLAGKQLSSLTAKVKAARDGGKRDFSACYALEKASTTIDGGRPGATTMKSKELCAEASAAENIARATTEVRAAIASKRNRVPYQCQFALRDLAAIETQWAKDKADELATTCYAELGVLMITAELPRLRPGAIYCPYEIREMMKQLAKYGIAAKHPPLEAAIAKLPAECKK